MCWPAGPERAGAPSSPPFLKAPPTHTTCSQALSHDPIGKTFRQQHIGQAFRVNACAGRGAGRRTGRAPIIRGKKAGGGWKKAGAPAWPWPAPIDTRPHPDAGVMTSRRVVGCGKASWWAQSGEGSLAKGRDGGGGGGHGPPPSQPRPLFCRAPATGRPTAPTHSPFLRSARSHGLRASGHRGGESSDGAVERGGEELGRGECLAAPKPALAHCSIARGV